MLPTNHNHDNWANPCGSPQILNLLIASATCTAQFTLFYFEPQSMATTFNWCSYKKLSRKISPNRIVNPRLLLRLQMQLVMLPVVVWKNKSIEMLRCLQRQWISTLTTDYFVLGQFHLGKLVDWYRTLTFL